MIVAKLEGRGDDGERKGPFIVAVNIDTIDLAHLGRGNARVIHLKEHGIDGCIVLNLGDDDRFREELGKKFKVDLPKDKYVNVDVPVPERG